MIEVVPHDNAHGYVVNARPNRSLSERGCAWTIAVLAIGSLSLSAYLAWRGLWMSLPFAGAELFALTLCLSWVQGQTKWHETYVLKRHALAVEQHRHGSLIETHFNPAWLRVDLQAGSRRWQPSKLLLASHGRSLEVGTFLTEAERQRLAQVIGELVAPRNTTLFSTTA